MGRAAAILSCMSEFNHRRAVANCAVNARRTVPRRVLLERNTSVDLTAASSSRPECGHGHGGMNGWLQLTS